MMIKEGVYFADLRNREPKVENPNFLHHLVALIWESNPPVLIYEYPALGNLKRYLVLVNQIDQT
jgi:hypothetical protein